MTATTRPADLATWRTAAEQADRFPEDRLPCPGCGASLRGANLADHTRRVHMADAPSRRQRSVAGQVGRDRRIRRTGRAVVALWVGGLYLMARSAPDVLFEAGTAYTESQGDPSGDVMRHHAELIARSPFGMILLGGLAVVLVATVLGAAGRFRARVQVTDRAVVLRHRLGTGTRRVPLPAAASCGSLIRHVGGSGGDENGAGGDAGYTEHAGTYVRVGTGRRTITVGCPTSTQVQAHWEGMAPDKERTRWDVTLAPADFVAFQYALAGAGVLLPRLGR